MKNLFTAAVILALILTPTLALQAVQQQQQPQQGQQPAQPAPKPPRVLGQPQTREEYDKYVAITQATDNQQRAKLSEDFLKDFPDSGLTPYVHQIAATTYQQLNNYDKLVEHGEATLKELPDNAVILTFLASGYAQRGKPDLAVERADKAVTAINALQAPPNVNPADFAKGKNDLLSMAYGSKGIAYVAKSQDARMKKAAEPKKEEPANPANPANPGATANGKKDDDPNLELALTNLKKAIELNPKDDLAYFEMGISYTLKNDADNAVDSYAKAVAIGGFVSNLAKDKLKAVLEAVLKPTQAGATEPLDQRVTKRMDEAVAKAKASLNAPPPSAPPPPPPPPPGQSKPPSNY
ncbi:MAG TPA: hypothetical protein VGL91_05120 [Acidobacteriota bacterium]|jgi:tetratricopeptide (TPR) repeat protein